MFIDSGKISDIYLYVDPVDFRKGIYGLLELSRKNRGFKNR